MRRVELRPGAKTQLGPDASGLGWIYEDKSGKHSLADLRYHLKSVPGVAEVAPLNARTPGEIGAPPDGFSTSPRS